MKKEEALKVKNALSEAFLAVVGGPTGVHAVGVNELGAGDCGVNVYVDSSVSLIADQASAAARKVANDTLGRDLRDEEFNVIRSPRSRLL